MELLETDSLDEFDKIYQRFFVKQFPLPSTRNVPAIRNVQDGKDRIVASGFIKLTPEAIIVTDQTIPKIERVKAIDLLIKDMKSWCGLYGVETVHAFVNSQFSRVLINRYGFKHIPAISLQLDLEKS